MSASPRTLLALTVQHRFPHFVQWPEHDASADTLGESTALPLWGEAKGRNGEGKLINSFHLQHFPHSIIFKLNKLSLGEREKVPAQLSPGRSHKAHIVGC